MCGLTFYTRVVLRQWFVAAQTAQRGCGLSLLEDLQKPPGRGPGSQLWVALHIGSRGPCQPQLCSVFVIQELWQSVFWDTLAPLWLSRFIPNAWMPFSQQWGLPAGTGWIPQAFTVSSPSWIFTLLVNYYYFFHPILCSITFCPPSNVFFLQAQTIYSAV